MNEKVSHGFSPSPDINLCSRDRALAIKRTKKKPPTGKVEESLGAQPTLIYLLIDVQLK